MVNIHFIISSNENRWDDGQTDWLVIYTLFEKKKERKKNLGSKENSGGLAFTSRIQEQGKGFQKVAW